MNWANSRIVALLLVSGLVGRPLGGAAASMATRPSAREFHGSDFWSRQALATPPAASRPLGRPPRRAFLKIAAALSALAALPSRVRAQDSGDLRDFVQNTLVAPDANELRAIESQFASDSDSNLNLSEPDNPYFEGNTVLYEQAREIRLRISLGNITEAKRSADFIIKTDSLRKRGWVLRTAGGDTRRVLLDGWYANTIRGTGITEPLADIGPNAYLALALLDLYRATGQAAYLDEARRIAANIRELQVTDENDPNYGAFRMGPLGDLPFPEDQRALGGAIPTLPPGAPGFDNNSEILDRDAMRRYNTFNTENTIDNYRLFDELAQVLEARGQAADVDDTTAYRARRDLVYNWLPKVYDKTLHYFFEGTLEGPGDHESSTLVKSLVVEGADPADPTAARVSVPLMPGQVNIIPIHPFDATHLVADALGPDRWDAVLGGGNNEFDAMIDATEDDNLFRVTARVNGVDDPIVLFDTMPKAERARMVNFQQGGKYRDQKAPVYDRRRPNLGSIEWTAWYSFSLLQAIDRAVRNGDEARVRDLVARYNRNARSAQIVFQNADHPGQAPYAVDMDKTQETGVVTAANDIPFYAWQTAQAGFGSVISQIAYFSIVLRTNAHKILTPNLFAAPPVSFSSARRLRSLALGAAKNPPVNEDIIEGRLWDLALAPDKQSWIDANTMLAEDLFGLHADWIEVAKAQAAVAAELAALKLNDTSLDRAGKLAALRKRAADILSQTNDGSLAFRLQTLADEIELLAAALAARNEGNRVAPYIDKMFEPMTLAGVGGVFIRVIGQDALPTDLQRAWERMLQSVYRTYTSLYHVGTMHFIKVRVNVQLGIASTGDEQAAYTRSAIDAAKNIIQFYSRAQAYDTHGFLWQIAASLANEYPVIYTLALKELAAGMAPQALIDLQAEVHRALNSRQVPMVRPIRRGPRAGRRDSVPAAALAVARPPRSPEMHRRAFFQQLRRSS